jgi:limonene-1,2-epoxide hydrolase
MIVAVCEHKNRRTNGITAAGATRFRCKDCGKSWTESTSTFGGMRIGMDRATQIVSMLCEVMSVLATSRLRTWRKRAVNPRQWHARHNQQPALVAGFFMRGRMCGMSPKEVVHRWVEAFNVGDYHALAAMYAEDATNHQVAESPVTGREQIKAMLQAGFAAAEMHCVVENLFQDGEWAILEWRDPQGLRGCGFFHVVNGKIVFQRGYWDKISFLRLHGEKKTAPLAH